jgi:hypothetical protein
MQPKPPIGQELQRMPESASADREDAERMEPRYRYRAARAVDRLNPMLAPCATIRMAECAESELPS